MGRSQRGGSRPPMRGGRRPPTPVRGNRFRMDGYTRTGGRGRFGSRPERGGRPDRKNMRGRGPSRDQMSRHFEGDTRSRFRGTGSRARFGFRRGMARRRAMMRRRRFGGRRR